MVHTVTTQPLAYIALSCALLSTACGTSDGQPGEQGKVRFSQVLDYGETDNFSSPLAAGRPLFLALQHPKNGFLDDETYAELTLSVQREDGSSIDSVWPFGFAQYGLLIEDPGSYWLIASQEGVQLDALKIKVERLAHISVSSRIQVKTTLRSESGSCSKVEEVSGLSQVVLHKNQRLELFVVPENSAGEPMLGLLALTAKAHESVQLDAPLFGQGARANALSIEPSGTMPERLPLLITDQDSGEKIEAEIATMNEDKIIACD